MTFSIAVTKRELVNDKLRGFGKDAREVLVYRPEDTQGTDWIAEAAPIVAKLRDPGTRLVHVFQTVADEPYGMESANGYVARMAEQSFQAMYDMDPLTNGLHLAIAPTQVVVAACKVPFGTVNDDVIGKGLAESVVKVIRHAGKKPDERLAGDWNPAIRFCTPKIQSILKALEPLADTATPAEITVTCHRANDVRGHRFEQLAPHDHIHAMLTLTGGLHHAIRWAGKKREDITIEEYFHARGGLTVRDSAKMAIMTAAQPYAHSVILNVDVKKQRALMPA